MEGSSNGKTVAKKLMVKSIFVIFLKDNSMLQQFFENSRT